MEYTNVVQLGVTIQQELKWLLEDAGFIGISKWDNLQESLACFIEALKDPVVSEPLDNYKIQKLNPVERLGLAEAVVTLTEDGVEPKAIAKHYSNQGLLVTDKDVVTFLNDYQSADITSKIEKANASVFDTQTQLQLLLDQAIAINEEIENLTADELKDARVTRPEVRLKALQESRQIVKDAAALAEAVAHMQSMEEYKKIVIDEVRKVDPKVANLIYKRIKQAGLLFGAI